MEKLGPPEGLAGCYEAGPGGYQLYRLLTGMGVACDVIAPSLVPIRAGWRAGVRAAALAGAGGVAGSGALSRRSPPVSDGGAPSDQQRLLRHGHIYRGGKSWTVRHQAWIAAQRLSDPLAQAALEHMLGHLAAVDAQIAALDGQLERVATSEPWAEPVAWLCSFGGIATRTALGLLAEIGDFRRFASPRELMSYLRLTPTEYSSGAQQHRGQITKAGSTHARRLLTEAAWNYQHRPRQSTRAARLADQVPTEITARAWQAQTRLFLRHRALTQNGNARPLRPPRSPVSLPGSSGPQWSAHHSANQPRSPLPDLPNPNIAGMGRSARPS